MTLIIALMAEHIYEKLYGEPYIATGWIVAIWIAHLCYHEARK